METSIDTVAKAQGLIESGPLSFVAALFAVAFFAMLWAFVRSKDQHREELLEVQDAYTQRAIKLEVAIVDFVEMAGDVHELTANERKRRERRESQTKIPVVLPPAENP